MYSVVPIVLLGYYGALCSNMETAAATVVLKIQMGDNISCPAEKTKLKISYFGDLNSDHIKKILESEFSNLIPFRIEYYDNSLGHFSLDLPFRSNSNSHKLLLVSLTRESYPSIRSNEILMIKGKEFDISHGIQIANTLITYSEIGDSSLGTGGTSWDASVVLAKYLEKTGI